MRSIGQRNEAVHRALTHARYEVLPTPSIEAAVLEHVPKEVRLTVTASVSRGLEASLDLVERLRGHGYEVTPHLAARMIRDRVHLAELVDRLVALGIEDVFVPAGDADPPVGDYPGSLELLRDLTELGRPFPEVGITGYPETHPSIDDDLTIQSMWDKREHATYIVSNLCFDAKMIRRWVERLRRRGVTLPVLIGMPGPVAPAKLLAVATKIGVGESARFLAKNTSVFGRIATPGGYRPGRLLSKVAPLFADPAAGVDGLHLFTFNQVAEVEAWRLAMLGDQVAAR
ncbi:MAG: methylenetetrahydrofolate reductase [Actinomycetota bacterium]|nr:methylenetetrahydrofolate reductase [Actinomycetota bacterium]